MELENRAAIQGELDIEQADEDRVTNIQTNSSLPLC